MSLVSTGGADSFCVIDLRQTVTGWKIPTLIIFAAAIDFVVIFFYIGDQVLHKPLGRAFSNFVNLEHEMNLPTWYSSIQLFVLAAFLFGGAA
jgi:hypothetical protein